MALTAGLVAMPAQAAAPSLTDDPYGDLAKALQMSLYFYDAEMSGPSRSQGVQRLEWRGDSEVEDARIPLVSNGSGTDDLADVGTNLTPEMISKYRDIFDPDGDGYIDLSGGYHDAGDHVKFGLPQTYTAATLGWGLYEFPEAYERAGADEAIMTHLRWFSDYFLRSTFRDKDGKVIAFSYMVGRGGIDHTYWGPPELQDPQMYPRSATFAYEGAPAADQVAGAAAALTVMALNTADSDPSYSATCLDTAIALYDFAKNNRGTGNGDGFYPSSFDDDEMSWAAAWLFEATQDESYLNDIIAKDSQGNYTGYLRKIINHPGDTWQNIWVHSWDTVWGGVFAKLAPLTKGVVDDSENQKFWYYFRWNAEYWTGGAVPHRDTNDRTYIATSPSGYSVISTWGSARYNTAAQLCALVYRKYSHLDWGDAAQNQATGIALSQWALSQMNYIMGDNPLSRSYIVGFTANDSDDYVRHPHHRAAHGSSTNSMVVPAEHRHTLWGALAGGPDLKDEHVDETTDYVYNEVAIDYNAAFVGALAGLYEYFGSDSPATPWAPTPEPRTDAYVARAKVEQENSARTQVSLEISNYSVHPPAFVDDLSLRYYFDISELVENGQSIDDVSVALYYDEAKTMPGSNGKGVQVIGPRSAGIGNVYYVEISWDGVPFYGKREVQIGLIAAQNSQWITTWDPTNDPSRQGLNGDELTLSEAIPVYRGGELVWGAEPDGAIDPQDPEDPEDPEDPGDPSFCVASVEIANSWPGGYQAAVTVKNNSSATISPWQLTFVVPSGVTVNNGWNGTFAQQGGNITVNAPEWAQSLAPGQSATVGFVANGPSSPAPSAVALGGVTCG